MAVELGTIWSGLFNERFIKFVKEEKFKEAFNMYQFTQVKSITELKNLVTAEVHNPIDASKYNDNQLESKAQALTVITNQFVEMINEQKF